MSRLLPLLIAAVAVIALTLVEGFRSGRWVDVDRRTAYCASLLNQVPTEVGDWESEDREVDDLVITTAGADGFVSRYYRNPKSGQVVDVWLIVGHSHDTAEHTPDSCYPAQGYKQRAKHQRFTIKPEGLPEAEFWTAVFDSKTPGRPSNRVFWSWFRPEPDGDVQWVAPSGARWHFGNTPALYKLYFTAQAGPNETPTDESICVGFAEQYLPLIQPILERANQPTPDSYAPVETSTANRRGSADGSDV